MMTELGEKNPNLLKTRYFFFGLFSVQNWEYRCVYTNAQIELMCADRSRIKYLNPQKKKKITQEDYDECVRLNMESIKKLRERKAKEGAEKQNQTI